MVRNLTLLVTKRLTRLIGADGKVSTHGVQQALGMFDRRKTPNLHG